MDSKLAKDQQEDGEGGGDEVVAEHCMHQRRMAAGPEQKQCSMLRQGGGKDLENTPPSNFPWILFAALPLPPFPRQTIPALPSLQYFKILQNPGISQGLGGCSFAKLFLKGLGEEFCIDMTAWWGKEGGLSDLPPPKKKQDGFNVPPGSSREGASVGMYLIHSRAAKMTHC